MLQDYATRLAAMRSRLSRPQSKHSRHKQQQQQEPGRQFQQDNIVDESQPYHIESLNVDPSVSSFEVVHKAEAEHSGPSFGGSMGDVSTSLHNLDHEDASVIKKARTSSFSEGTSQSKMSLLRKQMGESRTKFERQQRDNREKKANMDEMKKKVDMLRNELEQRDEFIQSFEKGIIPQHSQPTTHQLYQQLLQKDAIVYSLTARVSELEILSRNQKESLDEKECIINARTEAVALVTKDRDDKMIKIVEEIEERQTSMRNMQEEFTTKEEEWNRERSTLSRVVAEKTDLSVHLEENCRRIDSIRFELSTRNAELQERLVAVQGDKKELESNFGYEKMKNSEHVLAIKELKLKLCKVEAHGSKKLKNLEKHLKTTKQGAGGNESGQKILDLHNQIAVLEEEKGNLQLRLVDFDELKANSSFLEKDVESLKLKIEEVNKNLDEQFTSVSALQKEKIDFVALLNDRELKLLDLEADIVKFEDEREELKNNVKILESRVTVLDINLDSSISEQKILQSELESHASQSVGAECVEAESKMELERSVVTLANQVEQLKVRNATLVKDLEQHKQHRQQTDEEQIEAAEANQRLLGILTDKEDCLTNQSIEIDKCNALMDTYNAKIDELKDSISRLKLERDNSASTYRMEISQLDSTISTKTRENEAFVTSRRHENSRLNEAIDDAVKLRNKLSKLQDTMMVTEDHLAQQTRENSRLSKVIEENKKLIDRLENDIRDLENLLQEGNHKISDWKASVDSLETQLANAQAEYENLCLIYKESLRSASLKENYIEKLLKDYSNANVSLEKFSVELNDKISEVDRLVEEKQKMTCEYELKLQQKQESLALVRIDLTAKETRVIALETGATDFLIRLSQLESEINKKTNDILYLQESIANYSQDIVSKDDLSVKQQNTIDDLSMERDTYKNRCDQLNKNILINEKHILETSNRVELLVNENSTYRNTMESKEKELNKVNENILEKEELIRCLKEKLFNTAESDTIIRAALTEERELAALSNDEALQEKKIEIDALSLKLSEEQEQLSLLSETFAAKENDLLQIRKTLSKHEAEYEELKIQFDQLSKWYEQVNANNASLQEQLELSAQEVAKLEETFGRDQNLIIELQNQIETLKTDIQLKEHLIAEVKQSQDEKTSTLSKSDNEKQEKIDSLQEKTTVLQTEIDKLIQYNNELLQCQTKWEVWSKTVDEEKTASQATYSKCQASYQAATDKLNEDNNLLVELTERNKFLDNRVQELNTELEQNKSALLDSSETQGDWENKVFLLEEQLNSLRNENTESNITKDNEMPGRIRILELELATTDEKITELSDRLTVALRTVEEVKHQLKVKDDLVAGLEMKLSDDRSARSDDSRTSSRQSDADDAGRYRVLQNQLEEAHLTITLLQTTLATCEKTTGDPPQQAEEAMLGEVDLRDPLSSSPPSSRAAPEVIRLQQSLSEKTQLVEQMQEQLRTLRHSVHSLEEEIVLLKANSKTQEICLKEKVELCSQLEDKLEAHIESANSSLSTLASLELEKSNLVLQLNSVSEHHEQSMQEQLRAQNRQFADQLQEQTTFVYNLNIKITSHQSKIQELESIIAQNSVQKIISPAVSVASESSASVSRDASQLFSFGVEEFDSSENANLVVTETRNVAESAQESVLSFADLRFKLSWYEEQWATWTKHYTELQQNYQDAETRIMQLKKLLDERDDIVTPDPAPLLLSDPVSAIISVPLESALDTSRSGSSVEETQPSYNEKVQAQYNEVDRQYQELLQQHQLLQQQYAEVSQARQSFEEEASTLKKKMATTECVNLTRLSSEQTRAESDAWMLQLQEANEKNIQLQAEFVALQQQV